MILQLKESKLFTTDTALRFAKEYRVSPRIWNEVWKRHLEGVDSEALAGYILYKTGHKIKVTVVNEWLIKTEIYCRANHVIRMGVRVVQSEFFGIYEDFILKEVLRNMKSSRTRDTRILL